MARKQYPENLFISPSFAIKRMLGLRQKHGNKAALFRSEFKPEREAWITGVFLLGIEKMTGREFWLRVNREDSSPDTITLSLKESPKGVVAEMQNVEIVEYEKHATSDLIGVIEKKLKTKSYPDNFILLCYVHSRYGEKFHVKEISDRVRALDPKVAEVWVLSSIIGKTKTEHVVTQVFPEINLCKFDYIELSKASSQKEMITAHRGWTRKIDFKPLGKYILELP